MLTFSVNPTTEEVGESVRTVLSNPVNTDLGREWLSEGVIKGLEGRLREEFDANAYGFVCNENSRMNRSKQQVSMLNEDEQENHEKGVSESIAFVEDHKANSLTMMDKAWTVQEFNRIEDEILIEEGIDLHGLLTAALQKGEIKTINRVKELTHKYYLEELIEDVLSNPDVTQELGLREGLTMNDKAHYVYSQKQNQSKEGLVL